MESNEVFNCVKLTTTWFDDIKLLPPAKLTLEKRPAVSKKNMQLSERGFETFKRISKKRFVWVGWRGVGEGGGDLLKDPSAFSLMVHLHSPSVKIY